jgi:hypothetical protein
VAFVNSDKVEHISRLPASSRRARLVDRQVERRVRLGKSGSRCRALIPAGYPRPLFV